MNSFHNSDWLAYGHRDRHKQRCFCSGNQLYIIGILQHSCRIVSNIYRGLWRCKHTRSYRNFLWILFIFKCSDLRHLKLKDYTMFCRFFRNPFCHKGSSKRDSNSWLLFTIRVTLNDGRCLSFTYTDAGCDWLTIKAPIMKCALLCIWGVVDFFLIFLFFVCIFLTSNAPIIFLNCLFIGSQH